MEPNKKSKFVMKDDDDDEENDEVNDIINEYMKFKIVSKQYPEVYLILQLQNQLREL